MSTYTKEWVHTLGFFLLYLLVGHTAIWVILFGKDDAIRVLGFPLQYFVVLVLGWFGALAVSIWWNYAADKLDNEITGASAEDPVSISQNSGATGAKAGE